MFQIQKNMSLMLIDDSTDEVVACRVTNLAEKSEKFLDELKNTKTEQIKIIIDLINHLKSLCDTLSHYDVDNAVHFLALGVHKDYRRRGIGGKVMSAAVEIVRQLGLGPVVVTGEGTSNYSKSIYEKLGFETNAEVIYDEYKVNGELVFKNMGDQKSIRLYGKIVS